MATKRRRKRHGVIAQGHRMAHLGRTSFTKLQAVKMMKDLKNRGYGTPYLVEVG